MAWNEDLESNPHIAIARLGPGRKARAPKPKVSRLLESHEFDWDCMRHIYSQSIMHLAA